MVSNDAQPGHLRCGRLGCGHLRPRHHRRGRERERELRPPGSGCGPGRRHLLHLGLGHFVGWWDRRSGCLHDHRHRSEPGRGHRLRPAGRHAQDRDRRDDRRQHRVCAHAPEQPVRVRSSRSRRCRARRACASARRSSGTTSPGTTTPTKPIKVVTTYDKSVYGTRSPAAGVRAEGRLRRSTSSSRRARSPARRRCSRPSGSLRACSSVGAAGSRHRRPAPTGRSSSATVTCGTRASSCPATRASGASRAGNENDSRRPACERELRDPPHAETSEDRPALGGRVGIVIDLARGARGPARSRRRRRAPGPM